MKQSTLLMMILLIAAAVLMVSGAAAEGTETADLPAATGNPPAETEDLFIDPAELTEEPAFIDWIREDVPMQLIALRNAEGQVRLAFNTCQSCNGSPWAWFEYLGDGRLECQNCRQKLSVALIGDENARGCAPIPVLEFAENEDGMIVVPGQVFAEAIGLFANWRKTGE